MVVNTPDGPGPIENFDRKKNTVAVTVKHDIRLIVQNTPDKTITLRFDLSVHSGVNSAQRDLPVFYF